MALPSSQAHVAVVAPQARAGPHPRGKFASLTASSSVGGVGLQGGNSDGALATASSVDPAAAARRSARLERQAMIFASIDEAEDLALDIIGLASSTSSALSDLTTPSEDGEDASSRLEALIRSNGDEYLEKVKRVHALLTPHAGLVAAYRNHEEEDMAEPGASPFPVATTLTEDAGAAALKGKEDESSAHHKNMYAARVEMRLAMERKKILIELLRLEKKDLGGAAPGIDADSGASTFVKRKREEG